MRWLAAPMVWLSLLGVIALLVAGKYQSNRRNKYLSVVSAVYFTAAKYIELKDQTDSTTTQNDNQNVFESYATKKDTWLVLLIIASIVLAIVLLILIFLRKRIILAIALVKEGSKYDFR